MESDLEKNLLEAFPGKMEKKETFIMQFIMEKMGKGEKPPSKDKIKEAIANMVENNIFQEKDDLLILKKKKTVLRKPEVPPEEPIKSTVTDYSDYSPEEQRVLEAFEGKYENEQALTMQIIMRSAKEGQKPPSKDTLKKTIEELIDKEVLARKGSNLIKKV